MKHIFRIIASARELRGAYVVISIATISLSLMSLLMPLISGWAIDEMRLGTDADVTYVIWLAIAIFVLDLAQNVISNYSGYLGDQMSVRLNRILSARYYEHLLTLPQRYFDTELSGKIINRLNRSIVQITNFMQMMSNNFLQFIFTTIFSLIAVAFYSWEVAVLLFSLYPIYIFMTFKSSPTWQKYQEKKNNQTDIASGRFAEVISQIKVVKSYIQECRELNFFNKHMKKVVSYTAPQSKFWHTKDTQRRLALNVIFLFVYLFIFVKGAQGQISPGQAVALILYAMQIRIPIFTISFLVENTQRAISDSKDYFKIMDVQPEIVDEPDAKKLAVSKGELQFQQVSFSYDDAQPVFRNLDFIIRPGEKIAVVGESGEGKTTLTNLLMRLYQPQDGVILIDGQDIASVTQKSLRDAIGTVFQEPALFSGTIAENIGYAHSSSKMTDIKRVAKAANADEFINKIEKRYDAEIGERGLKLSGGQKQRIAIARALLKNPPILILDEATSSLDGRSESMVQEALTRLIDDRTTLIIAHRLSTIQHVDRIMTLKNGSIDEIGTPKQLATSGGIYQQLLELQRAADPESATQKLKGYEIIG
ncbi:ATP-binding cassette domain-containing protein [soil metagenome]